VYAAAYRLLDAFTMVGFLFATFLLPVFSRMLAQKQAVAGLLATAIRLLLVYAWILSLHAVVFREPIMHWLYDDADDYWLLVFSVVFMALNFLMVMYTYGALLTANRNLKTLNWISFGGLLLNIGLNFWLIPSYAALGAAMATLVTQAGVALAHLVAVRQLFRLKWHGPQSFRQVLFFLFVLLLALGSGFLQAHLPLPWWIIFAVSILLSLIPAFALQLIDLGFLWGMLRQKARAAE
jgi:O-antigen/teichoic acid export membrane protein